MATLPRSADWAEWAVLNLPPRLATSGLSANFVGNTLLASMDVMFQALSEAVLIYDQNLPDSPDDALPVVAQQANMPQYAWETNPQFRQRLAGKWSFWQTAGSPQSILGQLATMDLSDVPNLIQTYILFPGGSDWSLMDVLVDLSGSIGTGATLANGGTSALMNPAQAAALALIVGKFKPADWRVGRIEIITPSTVKMWDDPRPSPPYTWDDARALTWGAGDGTAGELLLSGSANGYTRVFQPVT